MSITRCAVIAFISLTLSGFSWAVNPPETPTISEFIVRYQNSDQAQAAAALSGAQRAMDMGARVGESLAHVRATKEGNHMLRAGRKLTRAEAWELATRMVQAGGVESAHPVDPDFDARPPARPPIK